MRPYFFAVFFLLFCSVLSAQENKTALTICWDNSLSMMNRDLPKDLSLLEKVFIKHPNAEVQLLQFGFSLQEENFEVINGDWSVLKDRLQEIRYEGHTSYHKLYESIKNSQAYVFTDGKNSVGLNYLILPKGSLVINSSQERDLDFLNKTVLLSRARLMDFAAMKPSSNILESTTSSTKVLKGTIYKNGKGSSNVQLNIKGSQLRTTTDQQGNFSIAAAKGDMLQIKTSDELYEIEIENVLQPLRFFVDAKTVVLDEVILEEKRLEQKTLVNTGLGWKDKASIGYAIGTLNEADIKDSELKMDEALSGKITGLNVSRSSGWDSKGTLSLSTIRGWNSITQHPYALIVVDGVPVQQSAIASSPSTVAQQQSYRSSFVAGSDGSVSDVNLDYLDPKNVESVTVLKGLAATNIYGTLGANGVILITTKTGATAAGNPNLVQEPVGLPKNTYTEDSNNFTKKLSAFRERLQQAASENEAYEIYSSYRDKNIANTGLYWDAFDFFRPTNAQLAGSILSNLVELYPDDFQVLKSVQLAISTLDIPAASSQLTDQLLKLEENNKQAFLNSALLNSKEGRFQEGLQALLKLSKDPEIANWTNKNFRKTVDREIKNLVFRESANLNPSSLDPSYRSNVVYKARLVFEWNDPEAIFQVQFVNPQKQFYSWEHSYEEGQTRFKEDVRNNHSMEEFELSGKGSAGSWIVNASYLGTKSLEQPFVLKCTLFTNFGTPEQKEEQILLLFNETNQKQRVKQFQIR